MDYATMPVAELETLSQQIEEKKQVLRQEQVRIQKAISDQVSKVRLTTMAKQFSSDDLAKMHQIITGAGGIASQEAVGTPGAK